MMRKLAIGLLVLGASACDRAPTADPAKPDSYAVQIPIAPAPGGSLQRLELPAAALVAIKRQDIGDVRVFDARGKVVPLAQVSDTPEGARHSTAVPIYPVIGPITGAPNAWGRSALSIRLAGGGAMKVVTIDSGNSTAHDGAPAAAVLLDTRGLKEPVSAISLDLGLPAGQPVTLTLVSSTNLKDWQPLAEKVVFRPADGAALLGGSEVALPGVDLHDRYVGIGWGGASGVSLKSASVVTSATAPRPRIAMATSGATLTDAHQLRFDVPGGAQLSAFRFTETGPDGIIPLRLWGRAHTEDAWQPLGAGTLRPESGGTLIDISDPAMISFRLEADSRTAGFSVAPKVELLYDPVELLVGLSGTPPYRLAAGQVSAPASYLALSEIAPPGTPQHLADLSQVRFNIPAESVTPTVTLQPGTDSALGLRKAMLWGALLLGTLVLAFAAIRLLRGAAAGASKVE